MSALKDVARLSFFVASRAVGSILPPGLLYFFFVPYSALRGLRPARREKHLPASRLPAPADDRPGFLRRWRYQAAIHQRWLCLLFSDNWDKAAWAQRFEVDGLELLDELKVSQPIVVLTVHTGAFLVLGGWLMQQGLGVGSIVMDGRVWRQTVRARERYASRFSKFGESAAFRPGDTRGLMRYLEPRRCVVLAPDHMHGRGVEGTWSGGRLKMANGAYRLARLTGSVVLPIVVTDAGRWRFRIDIGRPVPTQLIESKDDSGAASHVARELMETVAARPDQAAITLVGATVA